MEKSLIELPPAARAPATARGICWRMMNSRALLCVLGVVRFAAPALRAGTAVPRPSYVRWPKRIRCECARDYRVCSHRQATRFLILPLAILPEAAESVRHIF